MNSGSSFFHKRASHNSMQNKMLHQLPTGKWRAAIIIAENVTIVVRWASSYQDLAWFLDVYNRGTWYTAVNSVAWVQINRIDDFVVNNKLCWMIIVSVYSNCPGKHVKSRLRCNEYARLRVVGVSNVCYHGVKGQRFVSRQIRCSWW